MTDLVVSDAPYRGLAPFTTEDGQLFFGRDRECDLTIANLRGTRLTLLYGESGVGKSSLLHAGVVHRLSALARHNLENEGAPELAVAVLSDWAVDPVEALRECVVAAVKDACGSRAFDPLSDDLGLVETLEICADRVDGVLLIVLDQFEEHLLAVQSPERVAFDEALAEALNASDLAVHFVIALQEEFLALLDRFEENVPSLFANYLRLEHLAPAARRDAILKPLEVWNRIHGLTGDDAHSAEPEMVAEILQQGAIGAMHQSEAANVSSLGIEAKPIETAYLQLVMRRLWDEERRLHSRVLRYSTLKRTLGGASQIVKTHFDSILADLPSQGRRNAAYILPYLVTPAGYKARPSVLDLVGYAKLPKKAVEETLRYLADPRVRIVRPVSGLGGARYEVFHDILIPAVRTWWQQQKLLREKRKSRLLLAGLVLSVAVGVLLFLFASWAFEQQAQAEQQQRLAMAGRLANHALQLRDEQLDLSLLLSVHAHELGYASDSQSPLVNSLSRVLGLEAILGRLPSEVMSITCLPDRERAITAAADGTVHLWSIHGRHLIFRKSAADWVPIVNLVFSADGKTLATAGVDGTVRLWSVEDGLFPRNSFRMGASAWSLALNNQGDRLALGGSDGTVHLVTTSNRQTTGALRHRGAVQALAFSPDGRMFATGASDGTIIIWSIAQNGTMTGTALRDAGAAVSALAFDSSSVMLAAGQSDGVVRVWRDARHKAFFDLLHSNSSVRGVAFAPDGEMIATASEDGALRLWSVFGGPPLAGPIREHKSRMRSITFTRDGKGLVSGQGDGSVAVWSVAGLLHRDNEASASTDAGSLRARACQIANRNLTPKEWRRFMGEAPYRQTCEGVLLHAGVTPTTTKNAGPSQKRRDGVAIGRR